MNQVHSFGLKPGTRGECLMCIVSAKITELRGRLKCQQGDTSWVWYYVLIVVGSRLIPCIRSLVDSVTALMRRGPMGEVKGLVGLYCMFQLKARSGRGVYITLLIWASLPCVPGITRVTLILASSQFFWNQELFVKLGTDKSVAQWTASQNSNSAIGGSLPKWRKHGFALRFWYGKSSVIKNQCGRETEG